MSDSAFRTIRELSDGSGGDEPGPGPTQNLSDSERMRIAGWSAGEAAPISASSMHTLFEAQVEKRPEAVALLFDEGSWTYSELNRYANRVAHRLIAEGVVPGTRVGVAVRRSPQLIAALVGVLKAGGTYVALQPDLPRRRLDYVVQDAGVVTVVTDHPDHVPSGHQVDLHDALRSDASVTNPDVALDPEHLAYVLYTSGSTGRPKGVMIPHRAVANLLSVLDRQYPLTPSDVILQKTPFSFDVSVAEIFGPLASGAKLVMTDDGVARDPERMRDLIVNYGVTELRMTPTELLSLLTVEDAAKCSASIRRVLAAGEALTLAVCRKFVALWPDVELKNLWGPTEACVYASWWDFEQHHIGEVPIGRPLPNYSLYSVGPQLDHRPVDMKGELYVGGAGLAQGYHGMPGKTALSYVPNPFGENPGARMYRSGDLTGWNRDGQLGFYGRVDAQVQLRGMRVELGELEAALEEHFAVRHAAVLPVTAADGRVESLIAYVTTDRELRPAALREHLEKFVEPAKIPGQFVALDEMPRTSSGKIDRTALPDPAEFLLRAEYQPPRTGSEVALAGIWESVLGVERVGSNDNFFEVGGHSLLAVQIQHAVAQRLGVRLPLASIFAAGTLKDMAARIDNVAGTVSLAIQPADHDGEVPVSAEQRRMWFLHERSNRRLSYQEPIAIRLQGPLDAAALRSALELVVSRHEVLRTVYPAPDGEPIQRILDAGRPPWNELEVRDADEVEAHIAHLVREPFDLRRETPVRVTLFSLGEASHILFFLFHHIVLDEWMESSFTRELAEAYRGAVAREEPASPTGLQYADYTMWQRELRETEAFTKSLDFWTEHLDNASGQLSLPIGNQAGETGEERAFSQPMETTTRGRLRAISRSAGTTLFETVHAAFASFLARYTGQTDITLGVPVTMRTDPALRDTPGLLLNTVAIRSRPRLNEDFLTWLERSRDVWRATQEHHWVPLDDVVRRAGRSRGNAPLFDIMIAPLQSRSYPRFADAVASAYPLRDLRLDAKFPLTLTVGQLDADFHFEWHYDSARFNKEEMGQLVQAFGTFLDEVAHRPERPMALQPIVAAEERKRVLALATGPGRARRGCPTHELIRDVSRRVPASDALVSDGRRYTYVELEAATNRAARNLSEAGVHRAARVGVSMERTPEMVVALLAVMKAGAAYVPLPPDQHPEQLAELASDAGLTAVVCDERGAVATAGLKLPQHQISQLMASGSDETFELTLEAHDLAYILYTSGTTGRPKGVMITHGGLSNLMQTYQEQFECGLRSIAKAPVTFDMFVVEVFPLLCGGGSVAVPPTGIERDPASLRDFCERHQVTSLFCTPTTWQMLIETGNVPAGLEVAFSGGEALTAAVSEPLRQEGITVWNAYGPTEMCVAQLALRLEEKAGGEAVPIGSPFANHSTWLLDTYGEVVGEGSLGEVMISGPGEARGYRGLPRRTAGSFLPCELSAKAGARMYSTGDLAKWKGGLMHYAGRIDHQLQVRGTRVELVGVEAALLAVRGVVNAAVLPIGEAHGRAEGLVAYVVAENVGEATLLEQLRQRLSGAAVPNRFVFLDEMPLLTSGKVDRKGLPSADDAPREFHAPPRNELESLIASVWCEHLSRQQIGVHDDFFDVGGHSLLAMRVAHGLSTGLDVEVTIGDLFANPTVAGIANLVQRKKSPSLLELRRHEHDGRPPVSAEQRRMWFLQEVDREAVAYQVPVVVEFEGPFEARALEEALRNVVSRHEIFRTVYPAIDGDPMQHILADVRTPWEFVELSETEEVAAGVGTRVREPFDLRKETPLRVTLFRLEPQRHVALFLFHHIAIDEWGEETFLTELSGAYEAQLRGTSLPEAESLQYADYALWQGEQRETPAFADGVEFWREHLRDAPTQIAWTSGTSQAPGDELIYECHIDANVSSQVREVARHNGATLFEVMHAAFASFVARYTGQLDVTLGVPVSMRQYVALRDVMGLLLNTVAVRSKLRLDEDFPTWLKRSRSRWRETHEHRWVPYDEVVRESARSRGDAPLFDTMLAPMAGRSVPSFGAAAARSWSYPNPGLKAKFPLTVGLGESGGGLAFKWYYDSARFPEEDIHRITTAFGVYLAALAQNPTVPMREYSITTVEERAQVRAWSEGPRRPHPFVALHDRIHAVAQRIPDSDALVSDADRYTYTELDNASSLLARALRARGIERGDLVGVAMERTPQMIVTLIAVMRAGATYVPLAIDQHPDQIEGVVSDAGVKVVVHDGPGQAATSPLEVARFAVEELLHSNPDPQPDVAVDPEDIAYVLYTSGTTGRPKGVMIPHRALSNLMPTYDELCDCTLRSLSTAPFSFDQFVGAVFPLLCGGGSVAVAPVGVERDPARLRAFCERHHVTRLHGTPTTWQMIIESDQVPQGLKAAFAGGEALTPVVTEALRLRDIPMCNEYGPTEMCVTQLFHDVGETLEDQAISIGVPAPNHCAWVLDEWGQLVAPGSLGEVALQGLGEARGYLGRPRRTAQSFLPCPLSDHPGARMYATGDLARWNDGLLFYAGRTDHQLQVRGTRVELVGVEAALLSAPGVVNAAVIPVGEANGRADGLAAYIVGDVTEPELREHLRRFLSGAAIPSHIVFLDDMPRLSSGKVDRKGLPALEEQTRAVATAPRNDTEETIAEIWRRHLKVEAVGVHDDFFEVGGHSLLAMRVAHEVSDAFGVQVELSSFLESSTIEELADLVMIGMAAMVDDLDLEALLAELEADD